MSARTLSFIGYWLARKAREQAMVGSYYQAAKNLRKQGVPLEMALVILLG